MKSLELYRLEQGECTVLLGDSGKELLMVDCGGVASISEAGDMSASRVASSFLEKYSGVEKRSILLSHYHWDRLSALQNILQMNPNWFDAVYCPYSPCDRRGDPLLLEYGIFMEVFQKDLPGYDPGAGAPLYLFSKKKGWPVPEHLHVLKERDRFSAAGVCYEVLWPKKERYPFGAVFLSVMEELNVAVSSPFLSDEVKQFWEWKKELCQIWLARVEAAPEGSAAADERYTALLQKLPAMRETLAGMPLAQDIREILNRPVTRNAFRQEMNGASLVFHNRRIVEATLDDILFTGDATPETMDQLADKLYDGYFAVKVPGKGLPSYWSHVLGEISCQHLLISGSSYREDRMASEYMEIQAIRHCTYPESCAWYRTSGRSCNRMNICYDLPEEAALTIKCPFAGGGKLENCGCRIFLVGEKNRYSCLCDGLPAVIH